MSLRLTYLPVLITQALPTSTNLLLLHVVLFQSCVADISNNARHAANPTITRNPLSVPVFKLISKNENNKPMLTQHTIAPVTKSITSIPLLNRTLQGTTRNLYRYVVFWRILVHNTYGRNLACPYMLTKLNMQNYKQGTPQMLSFFADTRTH